MGTTVTEDVFLYIRPRNYKSELPSCGASPTFTLSFEISNDDKPLHADKTENKQPDVRMCVRNEKQESPSLSLGCASCFLLVCCQARCHLFPKWAGCPGVSSPRQRRLSRNGLRPSVLWRWGPVDSWPVKTLQPTQGGTDYRHDDEVMCVCVCSRAAALEALPRRQVVSGCMINAYRLGPGDTHLVRTNCKDQFGWCRCWCWRWCGCDNQLPGSYCPFGTGRGSVHSRNYPTRCLMSGYNCRNLFCLEYFASNHTHIHIHIHINTHTHSHLIRRQY
ncbi:unnamed protein product [Protopolystoma xenopodis]|uniref:Uncharacterized protein n=1 Tax=Protopolystoma xenopodis TaxID=117903 RepID=A0A3S5B2W8_9PLAT|nr:unnamed protein product [Protopolystoma xenopodis]